MSSTAPAEPRPLARRVSLGGLTRLGNAAAVWVVVVLLTIAAELLSPGFTNVTNMLNVVSQSSVVGVAAVGVTFVMLSGEMDVSVAGVATLTGVVGASIMDGQNGNIPLAIAAVVAIGAVIGVVNGLLVARGVQSFILTLAVGALLLGVGKWLTGGSPTGNIAPGYSEFFLERPLGIPMPAFILFAMVAVGYLIQRLTRIGHRIRLLGANPAAAYLSGVRITSTYVGAYVLSGVMAGMAGLVLLGRSGVPNDYSGMNIEFQALAAVVIGGTAFSGGQGSVIGTLAGTLFLSISTSLGIILGIPYGAQLIEYGGLIVIAGILYSFIRNPTLRFGRRRAKALPNKETS